MSATGARTWARTSGFAGQRSAGYRSPKAFSVTQSRCSPGRSACRKTVHAHGEPACRRCPAGLREHVVLECGRVDARFDPETLVQSPIRRIEQRTAIVEHDLAPRVVREDVARRVVDERGCDSVDTRAVLEVPEHRLDAL